MALVTLTQERIDFTSKDFESWLVELRALANAAFPTWTDFNRANIGNLLLELFSHTLDVMTHSIDQQTNERLIRTARQRKSMIDLGKLVNYVLPGATEASVNLEFTLAVARSQDVIIPAGTEVRAPLAEGFISFWTDVLATIPQGQTQITGVAARAAEAQQDTFTADGSQGQEVILSQVPFLDESDSVVIGGDTYTRVDNLLAYDSTDKVYTVSVDENDVGTLLFGDNTNGHAPTGAGICDYETGGGEAANVEANTITDVADRLFDAVGTQVAVVVRNPSDAGGGTDRMTVEEARVAIPESVLTANLVTCSRDQFEINPKNVRGVARTCVLSRDERTSIPEYTAEVYIMPTGGGLPSAALKAEVLTEITVTRPQPIGMDVFVLDPVLKVISISATVYLEQGITEAEARANIELSLNDFFALTDADGIANPDIDFGFNKKNVDGTPAAEVPWSDIFNAVRDATGIRKVEQSGFLPAADVTLDLEEFPILGSVTLISGDTGNSF